MSLLTVGQTLWDIPEAELRLMIEKNLAEFSPALIAQYSRSRTLKGEIRNTDVKTMVKEVKASYLHKIDMEMDGFLESFPKDAEVLAVNVAGWGWIYYVQNRDGYWNLIYDKHHPLCCEYAIKDFTNWVKKYGTELAEIMAEELEKSTADESPFAQAPTITCNLSDVTRTKDTVVATIKLEED